MIYRDSRRIDWKRQGFIEILAERVEPDKDLYRLSHNGLKTTGIYREFRIIGWKRQGFIVMFVEHVENAKDL